MVRGYKLANRGTKKSGKSKETDWVGPKFSKNELKRLKAAGIKYITVNRGGGRFKVSDLVATEDIKYKGKKVSGRGTRAD